MGEIENCNNPLFASQRRIRLLAGGLLRRGGLRTIYSLNISSLEGTNSIYMCFNERHWKSSIGSSRKSYRNLINKANKLKNTIYKVSLQCSNRFKLNFTHLQNYSWTQLNLHRWIKIWWQHLKHQTLFLIQDPTFALINKRDMIVICLAHSLHYLMNQSRISQAEIVIVLQKNLAINIKIRMW